jgi:hypothetical protein
MRGYIEDALESLSDLEYQRRCWHFDPNNPNFYDDLDLNVHILYDDWMVLPDPASCVGYALFPDEVEPFLALEQVFGPLLADLIQQNAPNEAYLEDPRWPSVVAAAGKALEAMRYNDNGKHPRTWETEENDDESQT